jgi:hypothetical protein
MALSNGELLEALRNGAKIPVPYFGDKEVELFFEDDEELLYFADTIREFLKLTEEDRVKDTRHGYAYFKDFVDDVGFEWVEEGMERLTSETDAIWKFVYPTVLGAQESWDLGTRGQLRKFVVLEGNCGWEQEHGILMSCKDGRELVKVSDYDGHATWGHAYNDLTKDVWVYYSNRPAMCTRHGLAEPSRSLLSRFRDIFPRDR